MPDDGGSLVIARQGDRETGRGALRSGPVRPVVRQVLLLACVLVTGCTQVVEGTPSAPTGVLLPPRPREVRLDGVDPCSLLTADQWAGLGFDGPLLRSDPTVELFRGPVPTCTISGFGSRPAAVGVGLVTTSGIERWQDSDLAVDITPTSVAGFPAVVAAPTRSVTYCSTDVDVARGQLVDVQVLAGSGRAVLSQQELCARAAATAELVMQELLAR